MKRDELGDAIRGENADLVGLAQTRELNWRADPSQLIFFPFGKCNVRVLLVTDGGLDFGSGDFGLRAFVQILQSSPYYVRYEVHLAHRGFRSGGRMMDPSPSIASRITNFRFDDPDHFAEDKYDEVWLFGIESTPGIDDSEIAAIGQYMNGGGGLFATGDHGALGKAMGGQIPRARSMRLWDHTVADPVADREVDEVSMGGARRNDTNRLGRDTTSEFNDQSDDVPQVITPRLYRRGLGIWETVFPHPLLCGRRGVLKVMPDHPHEGECIEPLNVDDEVPEAGPGFQEYPAGTNGNPRPLPEVISTSSVLSGTTSGGKSATNAHTFGGICAYDGHRASVGRVVTDATWHHFVNVNLVGETGAASPKDVGFLATTAGQAHLEDIKNYYSNLAIWLVSPELLACMRRRIFWATIFDGRVIEAVATTYRIPFENARFHLLWQIGKHARDVLGRATSVCQSRRLILDLLWPYIDRKLYVQLDPWIPDPPPPDPWFDPSPLLDAALGGAMVALRDEFLDADGEKLGDVEQRFDDIVARAVEHTVQRALEDARGALEKNGALLSEKGR